MANAPIAQGTLNRLRGAVQVVNFPALNVVAANLGEAGMTLNFEGDSTMMINTLTGRVTSPELFIPASITIPLLKTQGLADLYKQQVEKLATIGDVRVFTESTVLGTFTLTNCAISKIDGFPINGKDAVVPITIAGTYQVNANLYNL